MTNATMRIFGLVCVIGLLCSLSKAVVGIEDAFAWYELDAASSGNVTVNDIVDSNGPNYYTTYSVGTTTTPTWTTATATGPGGITTDEMAVNMTGSDLGIKIAQKSTADIINLEQELYGTYTAGATSGSLSMFVRVYVTDAAYSWDEPLYLISNYTRGIKRGVCFKLLGTSTVSTPHAMVVRPCVLVADGSVQTSLYSNGFTVPLDEWVDVAFSYNSTTGKVIMSKYDATDGFEAIEFDYTGLVAAGYDKTHFLIGSSLNVTETAYETPLPGSIESFAMWNTALTAYEMKALSRVPVDFLYGDANGDGMVTAGDYASVCSHFGDMGDPGIPGDANLDGVVSAGDYASVQSNFGSTSGGQILPEPATMSLVIVGGLSLIRRRKN